MQELVVSEALEVAGRGIAVLFERDPDPLLPWCQHRVEIVAPDGTRRAADAHTEFVRKVPPGEVQALLFKDLGETEIPVGSRIIVF